MKANIFGLIKRMSLLLLGSALLGTLLLVLVFCLPVEPMRKHVFASLDQILIREDQVGEDAFSGYLWEERETYTDAIMVQNAIEKVAGKNVYEHAMWAYHYDLEEDVWTPEQSLKALGEEWNTDNMYLHEYSRYWHGYLVYLKPLLAVFTWHQVVVIGIVLQVVMMAAVIFLSLRRKKPGIGIAMLVGFFFMKPVLVLISLTMSVCWVITLAAMLAMLLWHEKLELKKHYPELFLMVGILVGYFDFLTYPVVTLGFPLCTYFLLKEKETLKQSIGKVVGYSICWGIGYAGMWAMKWIIADLTLHTGTIKDAAWSIIGRTEAIGGRPRVNGGWYVISLNLQEYKWNLYLILAIVIAALALGVLLTAFCKVPVKQVLSEVASYFTIFCIPFAWIIVVQHHSALHARFTFRIISVAILAVLCMGISLAEEIQKQRRQEKSVKKS
ncbi:MAG: hypothetical protein J6C84_00020 [Lachnospiraceae bacterium]|nr:hypothetical protein [Lachnospiraceae bacterium]